MHETLVKYLAGLLDADGSLSLNFRLDPNNGAYYFINLRMNLASSDAVDLSGFVPSLPKLTGMGTMNRYGAKKQFVSWQLFRRADLEMFLPRVIKHMVIKGKHWQWLLDQWRKGRRGGQQGWTCGLDEREAWTASVRRSRIENVGPRRPKNHPTWAWVAGYLDGDGSYIYKRYVHKGYGQWSMRVTAVAHKNDICGLEFLQKAFGGEIGSQGQSGNVKVWTRNIGYQNRDFALRFLPHLAKHSRLKRYRIDPMIHHHQQRLTVPGVERSYCKVEGCDTRCHGQGFCQKHYLRLWRRGQLDVSDSLNTSLCV